MEEERRKEVEKPEEKEGRTKIKGILGELVE